MLSSKYGDTLISYITELAKIFKSILRSQHVHLKRFSLLIYFMVTYERDCDKIFFFEKN